MHAPNVPGPSVSVGVTRLSADVTLPHYHTPGAAGFDLAASVDLTVAPGAVALVPTGLVMALPAGYCLGVFARSSTPLKRGLMVANGVGVVDSDYCGPTDEIKIEVFNFTTAPVQVRAGDRLAQGLILPVARATWVERDRADAPSRGGFGSTG